MAFGRTFLANNQIYPTRVSADGRPNYKQGGVTIDWTTVQSNGGSGTSTTTLGDGSIVYDNLVYLRYGQVLTMISATGKYGPYDSGATDGRQTLTRGQCYILDQTVTQYATGVGPNSVQQDQIGGVFDDGVVYFGRLLQSGTNTSTKALGPTLANLNTAFPALKYTATGRMVP